MIDVVVGDIVSVQADAVVRPATTRLEAATEETHLDEAGVTNQLHTVEGGGHGGFSVEESIEAYEVIRAFLARHVTGD